MKLQFVQNFLGKPSHKIQRDGGGNYTQPPAPVTAQNPAVASEDGKIITDENGNAIGV